MVFKEFHHKYAVLWQGLRISRKFNPIFNILFIIRRLMFAWVIVYLLLRPQYFPAYFQCILIKLMSLALCCYIGLKRPFNSCKTNLIELFNEFSTLAITIQISSLLNFSDFDQLYTQGLMVNYTLIAMFGTNVLYVMLSMVIGWINRWIESKQVKVKEVVTRQKIEGLNRLKKAI